MEEIDENGRLSNENVREKRRIDLPEISGQKAVLIILTKS